MILKISSLCKKILIAALVVLGIVGIATTTVRLVKVHKNNKAETTMNKTQKLKETQELQENHIQYVPKEEDLGSGVIKHIDAEPYEGENKYWGVQTYANVPGIEGAKGYSSVPAILEEGKDNVKNIVLGFKPSDKKEDIFDKYRDAIEGKKTFDGRDLLPFQLVDLENNKTNKVYYGMPRRLEKDVMDKNGLKLSYKYNVDYKDGKTVEWNFYERYIGENLGERSTLVQIDFKSDNISLHDKHQLHKVPLGNSLPEDFVDMLSKLETSDLDELKNLGLELKTK